MTLLAAGTAARRARYSGSVLSISATSLPPPLSIWRCSSVSRTCVALIFARISRLRAPGESDSRAPRTERARHNPHGPSGIGRSPTPLNRRRRYAPVLIFDGINDWEAGACAEISRADDFLRAAMR